MRRLLTRLILLDFEQSTLVLICNVTGFDDMRFLKRFGDMMTTNLPCDRRFVGFIEGNVLLVPLAIHVSDISNHYENRVTKNVAVILFE